MIDGENAHQGQGSLKLSAPAAPASVISEAFVPDVQSSLDVQVFLRSSGAGAKVRVWVEGESAGKPYVRRSELERLDFVGRAHSAGLGSSGRRA